MSKDTSMTSVVQAQRSLLDAGRMRLWEPVLWLALFASPLRFTQYAAIVNEIAIVALFAISLDLVLGYTGIVSLGHAAFFGFGAYAAALFASGRMTLEDAGDRVSDIVRGPWVSARKISPQRIEGEIVHVDRFGNCITNLTAQDWAAIQGRTRMLEVRSYYFSRMNRIYGEVERGRKLILVGASGCIEIAIREGHASDRMQLRAGEPVVLNGLD